MFASTLSSKGQTVLPKEIRRHLKVKPGDKVGFSIDAAGLVTVHKLDPLDAAFLRLASESFSDWNDPEAERAFRDL